MDHIRSRMIAVGGMVVATAAMLTACSETPPPSPPPTAPATTAVVEKTAPPAKGKGKKALDPTANMGLEELRAYKRQMREQGKAP